MKHLNDATIRCKIKIDFEREDIKFKLYKIKNILVNCCRLIYDFGFLCYLNLIGYNYNFVEIKKFTLL